MVANLSSHKRGWDDRWEEFSNWADRGKACHDELLALVDADTDAFNRIMAAFGMPRDTPEEVAARDEAVQSATRTAIEVPLRVMEVSLASMDVIAAMADSGLAASASDAGVGAVCARAAATGAYLNVAINAPALSDVELAASYVARAGEMRRQAAARESEILAVVEDRL
jgi:glutamate formiminotransferase/formiminotetrahydrofolate cyclodeaminase